MLARFRFQAVSTYVQESRILSKYCALPKKPRVCLSNDFNLDPLRHEIECSSNYARHAFCAEPRPVGDTSNKLRATLEALELPLLGKHG